MKQIITKLKNIMKPQPKLTAVQIESIIEDAVYDAIQNSSPILDDPSSYEIGLSVDYDNRISLDFIELQDTDSIVANVTNIVTKKICETLKIED